MHNVTITLAALAALVATPVCSQSVHKWVDADGVTHYGARPPLDRPSEAFEPSYSRTTAEPDALTRRYRQALDNMAPAAVPTAAPAKPAAAKMSLSDKQRLDDIEMRLTMLVNSAVSTAARQRKALAEERRAIYARYGMKAP